MNDEQYFDSRVAPSRNFFAVSHGDICIICQSAIQPKEICVGCLDSDDVAHLDCIGAQEGEEN